MNSPFLILADEIVTLVLLEPSEKQERKKLKLINPLNISANRWQRYSEERQQMQIIKLIYDSFVKFSINME